jgi:hypothetical protein
MPVLTLAFDMVDGGTSNRSWEVGTEWAETLAAQLGEPILEVVIAESELQSHSDLVDRSETPIMWGNPTTP